MTIEKATFAAGCFWCIEAVFQRVKGVKSVISGYAGGTKPNPTYDDVCSGNTGHAEAVEITFDSRKINYEGLLDIFWKCHDPTSLNRQGADIGEQYRSAIFYHDARQKKIAEKSKEEVQKNFNKTIVTKIKPLKKFYKGEDYHQNYFNKNINMPYCQFAIKPKLKKLGMLI